MVTIFNYVLASVHYNILGDGDECRWRTTRPQAELGDEACRGIPLGCKLKDFAVTYNTNLYPEPSPSRDWLCPRDFRVSRLQYKSFKKTVNLIYCASWFSPGVPFRKRIVATNRLSWKHSNSLLRNQTAEIRYLNNELGWLFNVYSPNTLFTALSKHFGSEFR